MWEFLKSVTNSPPDMVKKVLVVWLSVKRIFHSQWMVLFLTWSLILIAFLREWQSGTLSKRWSLKCLLWRVDSFRMLLHSDHLTWRRKQNKFTVSGIRSMEMRSCSTLTVVRNFKTPFSSVPFIINDWDIWLMIKCMQGPEVQL